MQKFIQYLLVTLLIFFVFYWSGLYNREYFSPPNTGYRPGHAKRHPDQDIVAHTINGREPIIDDMTIGNLDPDTLQKLNATILISPKNLDRTSLTAMAYNDIGVYRPAKVRPFNDAHSIISEATMESGNALDESFDNNYYLRWLADEKRETELIGERADKIIEGKINCVPYKNVNQCMSVCNNTFNCTGFYIDSPGTCCMLVQPPYNADRHSYDKLPNNLDVNAERDIDLLIRKSEWTDGKIVFDKIGARQDNSTYTVNMDRQQCHKLCPKCIMGRCPINYRCVDMTADPRYNYSCIITNEDRYDERKGHTFDDPKIPYLADRYALNQYAGFDDLNVRPVETIPPTERYQIDGRILPTALELQKIYGNYDKFHAGPHTFGSLDMAPFVTSHNIAIRGANDPVNLHSHKENPKLKKEYFSVVNDTQQTSNATLSQIPSLIPNPMHNPTLDHSCIPNKDQMFVQYMDSM